MCSNEQALKSVGGEKDPAINHFDSCEFMRHHSGVNNQRGKNDNEQIRYEKV